MSEEGVALPPDEVMPWRNNDDFQEAEEILAGTALEAAEVLEEMERDFTPDAAWRLSLDENGKLLWTGEPDGEAVELGKDPGSTWWNRFVWGLMRLFPLENEL